MFTNQLINRSRRAERLPAGVFRLVLLCSVLLLLSGLTVGAHASLAAPAAHAPSGAAEEVRVILRSTGFEPAELARSASNFQLIVENRSGAADLTLRLLRVAGEQEETVRDVAFPSGATEVSEAIALPAGEYRLVVLHRPAWLLRLNLH